MIQLVARVDGSTAGPTTLHVTEVWCRSVHNDLWFHIKTDADLLVLGKPRQAARDLRF